MAKISSHLFLLRFRVHLFILSLSLFLYVSGPERPRPSPNVHVALFASPQSSPAIPSHPIHNALRYQNALSSIAPAHDPARLSAQSAYFAQLQRSNQKFLPKLPGPVVFPAVTSAEEEERRTNNRPDQNFHLDSHLASRSAPSPPPPSSSAPVQPAYQPTISSSSTPSQRAPTASSKSDLNENLFSNLFNDSPHVHVHQSPPPSPPPSPPSSSSTVGRFIESGLGNSPAPSN